MERTLSTFSRMLIAIIAGGGVAVASLLATAMVLKTETQVEFGLFAFNQVLIGLGYGISNALFGAPLSVALNSLDRSNSAELVASFRLVNLLFSALFAIGAAIAMWSLGTSLSLAILYGVSAFASWMRWYFRSQANASHAHAASVRSDISSSVLVIAGLLVLWLVGITIERVVSLQCAAAVIGCVPVFISAGRSAVRARFSPFREQFKRSGKHALIGVVSTEATANAHSYLVTMVLGPAAFAPLAAAQLFFRPVGVAIMSITQFERPRLSALLQGQRFAEARRSVKLFSLMLCVTWVANVVLAWWVMRCFENTVLDMGYQTSSLNIAITLTAVIVALRCVRAPSSALLQANASFKRLSMATIISGVVSFPVMFVLVKTVPVEWTLSGVIVAEVVCVVLILVADRKVGLPVFVGEGRSP